jgi:hypothetical protein
VWKLGSDAIFVDFSQLKSFRRSVYEAAKCVKPGGVFLLVEGDFEYYAEDTVHFQEPQSDQFPCGSWLARYGYGAIFTLLSRFRHCSIEVLYTELTSLLITECQTAAIKRGQDILIALASCDTGLWGLPGYDQDTIGSMSLFTPLGTWPQSKSTLFTGFSGTKVLIRACRI